jgi:hypothetical protein
LGTFFLTAEAGHHATVVTCVDDFLITETGGHDKVLTMRILSVFATDMGGWDKVKYEDRPTSFKGYGIAWSRDGSVATLHMTTHVDALAARWVPELLEGVTPADILSGTKLNHAADALAMVSPRPLVLNSMAKSVQEMGGGVKFVERGVMPRMSRLMHKISCVSAAPPPEAYVVARSAVAMMYRHRCEGITFGGGGLTARAPLRGGLFCDVKLSEGAPVELECMADAAKGEVPVYAYAVTCNGGVIAHGTKKIAGLVPNTCLLEAKGSTYASEYVELGRNAMVVFGSPCKAPTLLGTDNSSHLSIALGTASTPARAKPDLLAWASIKDRIYRKVLAMGKVATDVMSVDFMTKWIKHDKMEEQLAYLINSRHAVWPT